MSDETGGVLVNDEVALRFFKHVKDCVEDGHLNEGANAMMKEQPKLLECPCPETDDNNQELKDWSGKTAAECLCTLFMSAGARDVLLELVVAGAVATKACYEISQQDTINADFLEVLLITGYMPLKGSAPDGQRYFLDEMVEGCEDEEPIDLLGNVMKILHGRVWAGDNNFGFGKIEAHLVEKIANLPKLEVGVTHKENGPFAEFQKDWLAENPEGADWRRRRRRRLRQRRRRNKKRRLLGREPREKEAAPSTPSSHRQVPEQCSTEREEIRTNPQHCAVCYHSLSGNYQGDLKGPERSNHLRAQCNESMLGCQSCNIVVCPFHWAIGFTHKKAD